MKPFFSVLFLINSCFFSFAQNIKINITDCGAIGDAQTLNTKAIQRAIDTCALLGGGQVIIPAGTFLSGSIFLKSGVELHLTEGGVLLGSSHHRDYSNNNKNSWYGFILSNNQKKISITGKGTIDGQGRVLVKEIIALWRAGTFPGAQVWDERLKEKNRPNERFRPQLILFTDCQDVNIEGINLTNGCSWIQTYWECINLNIKNICVESTSYWNNDGIDIVDCQNVHISHCFVNSADDAICLKSFMKDSRCDNILVEHCTLRSSASAFKLGTSSYGGFRNIRARHLTIYDTYRSAIALECVDGGVLESVHVSDVKATNTGNAIFIKLGHRLKERPISRIENISIQNVEVQIPTGKPDKGYETEGPPDTIKYNLLPSSITGLPQHPIKDVVLKNIKIIHGGGGTPDSAYIPIDSLHTVPEQAHAYPEFSMFGELPAWNFYLRHITGIVFENIVSELNQVDYRPSFAFDDVKNVRLVKIKIPDGGLLPAFFFKDTKKIVFKKNFLPKSKFPDYQILVLKKE